MGIIVPALPGFNFMRNYVLDIPFFPALAGFQSEHEVEIPFMLTSDDSETTARGPKKPRVGGVLDGSSNWKVPRDSFS